MEGLVSRKAHVGILPPCHKMFADDAPRASVASNALTCHPAESFPRSQPEKRHLCPQTAFIQFPASYQLMFSLEFQDDVAGAVALIAERHSRPRAPAQVCRWDMASVASAVVTSVKVARGAQWSLRQALSRQGRAL